MTQRHLTEDMTLDRKVWRSRKRVEESSSSILSPQACSQANQCSTGEHPLLRDAQSMGAIPPFFLDLRIHAFKAFDAPWPVVQANAVYLCSSVLSL
ncbi:hypothetical protein KY289_035700 [Solanum tuberosum]|nr:hypothetical protein KY289_035700 [Solanum tuberosum]